MLDKGAWNRYERPMKPYLSLIDTDTTGNRNDVTPLFADANAFAALIEELVQPFADKEIDAVLGIDALGFILGTAVALRLGIGVVPIRKGGKLPVPADSVRFVDYSGESKSLELRKDALAPQTNVLIVDEWVETGAQVRAAVKLAEAQGATVSGIATICMDEREDTRDLRDTYLVADAWHAASV